MSSKLLSLVFVPLTFVATSSSASIVLNLGSATLTNDLGAPLAANTLIQLVNLGPNGVFDAISLEDGNINGINRWVSGDDTVLDISFRVILGQGTADGDFASTKAFDLEYQADSTPGFLTRAFEFQAANLPEGLKLGIRWFPGLVASQFDSITLQTGQPYGQFTRQANPVNLGVVWVSPADGANVTFDPLVTQSFGGSEPNSMGAATLVVPEPAAIGMSLLGAAGLTLLRRRRA